jgi:hypothetical protein
MLWRRHPRASSREFEMSGVIVERKAGVGTPNSGGVAGLVGCRGDSHMVLWSAPHLDDFGRSKGLVLAPRAGGSGESQLQSRTEVLERDSCEAAPRRPEAPGQSRTQFDTTRAPKQSSATRLLVPTRGQIFRSSPLLHRLPMRGQNQERVTREILRRARAGPVRPTRA